MEIKNQFKNIDSKGFFTTYVNLMSVFSPISTLRKQDKRVLAELMYMNYHISKDYKDREDPKKWVALFDYDTKLRMKEHLSNMSDQTFANSLTVLRKKGLLSSDNYLHSKLRLYPDEKNLLTFEFNIK
jgi:hypothetical protein